MSRVLWLMYLFSGMSWFWPAYDCRYVTLFMKASGAFPATKLAVSFVKYCATLYWDMSTLIPGLAFSNPGNPLLSGAPLVGPPGPLVTRPGPEPTGASPGRAARHGGQQCHRGNDRA